MKKKASKKGKKGMGGVRKASKAPARSNFGIRPLGDRVIVREEAKEEHKKTEAGILVPDAGEKDTTSRRGEVVAVGPGRIGDDNELLPMTLKKGDRVLFQWGEKVKFDGVDYFVVREGDILGILS